MINSTDGRGIQGDGEREGVEERFDDDQLIITTSERVVVKGEDVDDKNNCEVIVSAKVSQCKAFCVAIRCT